jgi:hypothetical protein
MHITLALILLIAAAISLGLDAFRVQAAVSWTPLGFMFVTLSWIAAGAMTP